MSERDEELAANAAYCREEYTDPADGPGWKEACERWPHLKRAYDDWVNAGKILDAVIKTLTDGD